ncbi:MAG: type 4a pilus biogenesis protein PilO [Candidatus Omnitrophota bacterium]|nr:type 4a pilus biogenesis protein PilO [Candidatus Omnitrophota bacterium]
MIDININNVKNSLKLDRLKEFWSDELNRMYVILGGTALLAILYLTFLIIPKFGQLTRVSREVSDLNDKINLVNSRVKRLDETKKKLNALREERARYAKQLPEEKEVPEFLEWLAATADRSNMKILSVTPREMTAEGKKGKKKVKQYYFAMPILVTAKSGYHQLGHFVDDLEHGKRFITIENLSIKYDPKFPRRHNVRMDLKTYVSMESEKN